MESFWHAGLDVSQSRRPASALWMTLRAGSLQRTEGGRAKPEALLPLS